MRKFTSGIILATLLSSAAVAQAQVNAADSVMNHAKGNKLGSVLKPSCKPILLST